MADEMNIYEALEYVQQHLNAPKNQRNDFGKYNYRSCEDILEAAKPHLAATHSVILLADDVQMIGDRYYIRAQATFCHAGETISTSASAREEDEKKGMDSAQLTGATSSYARKYALNGLLAIDDNKDADATNDHGKGNAAPQAPKPQAQKPATKQTPPPPQPAPQPRLQPQPATADKLFSRRAFVDSLLEQAGMQYADVEKWISVKCKQSVGLEELADDTFNDLCAGLERKAKERKGT